MNRKIWVSVKNEMYLNFLSETESQKNAYRVICKRLKNVLLTIGAAQSNVLHVLF
jgi:hypothetical protein